MEKTSSSSDFSKVAAKSWQDEEEKQRLVRELNDTHKILIEREKKIEQLEKALVDKDDQIKAVKEEMIKQKEDIEKKHLETLKKRDELIASLKKQLEIKEILLEEERNKTLWQFLFQKKR